MNDSLYNPDSMSKEDIKTLFVARQSLLDELVTTIKTQPKGAGVQHLLIISPRGMGKTTMLLMTQFAVEDNKDLANNWQAVRFPEESYDITELADFWLKVLDYLDDRSLKPKIEEIESKYKNSEDLREAAWALIKDWSKQNKKRIVLLVDNFDMILDQIGSDNEQARLRDILMNDGTVMLIGCSPSYFHQIQDYGQPLYNFFKVFNLNDLKFPDIEELIRRRAEIDEVLIIEELLQKNRTRVKALETFTGGNPRLVLMLYRIITSSDMTEIKNGLERLLDAVTPFYKDKTEKLPPQQRKIINEIAQYSLEKSEGVSPTEIAQRIRMTPNQVSSQLKRLTENGYVKSLNIHGRSTFYVISESLYAIWVQMRFGRNAREKRNWLIQILKSLFDAQEIQNEILKTQEKYSKLQDGGHEQKARGTLEYLLCLLETDSIFIQNNFNWAVYGYLMLEEIPSLKNELTLERVVNLPKDYIEILRNKGLINSQYMTQIKSEMTRNLIGNLGEFIKDVSEDLIKDKYSDALNKINQSILAYESNLEIERDEDYFGVGITLYILKSIVLAILEQFEEAIVECDKAIQILIEKIQDKNIIVSVSGLFYFLKGMILREMCRFNEAIIYLAKAAKAIHGIKNEKILKTKDRNVMLAAIYLQKTFVHLNNSQLKEASISFVNCKKIINDIEWDWVSVATHHLLENTKTTSLKLVKELITLSNFEDEFFPLIRAIDYLETKNEILIEKLSPEIRLVVEETIKTLQMIVENKKGDSI